MASARLARRVGTPAFLSVTAAAVVAAAINAHGFPVRHVDLNDGGVWVTNNDQGGVGRFNKPIAQLDGLVSATTAAPYDLDVLQHDSTVFFWDRGGGKLSRIDVAKPATVGDAAAVSSTAQTALGGSTLAVLDAGALRIADTNGAGGVAAVNPGATAVLKNLLADATMGVGVDGTTYVATDTDLITVPRPGASGRSAPTRIKLDHAVGHGHTVTVVGALAVVADPLSKTVQ